MDLLLEFYFDLLESQMLCSYDLMGVSNIETLSMIQILIIIIIDSILTN